MNRFGGWGLKPHNYAIISVGMRFFCTLPTFHRHEGKCTVSQAKKPAKIADGRNVQYLNVDLTKEMKSALVKWTEGNPDLWDLLEKALDSGLKFGCSWDNYNECFQAQFTQLPKDAKNPVTLVLIGRGATLIQAFQALQYKYWVVLQESLDDGDIKNARGVTDWG